MLRRINIYVPKKNTEPITQYETQDKYITGSLILRQSCITEFDCADTDAVQMMIDVHGPFNPGWVITVENLNNCYVIPSQRAISA